MPNIQPKSGENHKLFGQKYSKVHRFTDDKWKPQDKLTQYESVKSVYQKGFELSEVKEKSEFQANLIKRKELTSKAKRQHRKLNSLQFGELQRIKNVFVNNKEQQLVYSRLPMYRILEDVSCKLFDKRKSLDLFRYEQNKYSQIYEAKIKDLAKLQDRVKYIDTMDIDSEMIAKKLRFALNNARVQLKTYECWNRDCVKLIEVLSADSLHYSNVLDSLEGDVKEQIEIITGVIEVGLPELVNLTKYTEDLNTLERLNDRQTKLQIASLVAFKQKLLDNEQRLQNLIRKEDDVQIDVYRYHRRTPSMLELRARYKATESDMQKLCAVATCPEPNDVYPALKEISSNLENIKSNVNKLEDKLQQINQNLVGCIERKDTLVHNFQKEDIERLEQVEELHKLVDDEVETAKENEKKVVLGLEKMFIVQYSVQHLADVLKNVGNPHQKVQVPYPDPILELPLLDLHVGAQNEISEPPFTIEEDIEKLIETVMSRVEMLVEKYDQIQIDGNSSQKCKQFYHDLVLNNLSVPELEIEKEPVDVFIPEEYDPNVKSREEMKLLSLKIIEKHAHDHEDD